MASRNNFLDKNALKIVKTLQEKGFLTYLVGGAVRDFLLKRQPLDYDIVTNATPNVVEKLFAKTKVAGKHFGVILVILNGKNYEVATFRGEGKYSDKRRPDSVFWTNAKEDVKRRDFTINGLLYDPLKKEMIDYVEGKKDLQKKTLRFIGDAQERIKEDNLRILRAVRLKTTLKLRYARGLSNIIGRNANLLKNLPKERIYEEIYKMLTESEPKKVIMELKNVGLYNLVKPQVEQVLAKITPKLEPIKPLLSGHDLIGRFKLKEGPKIGQILDKLVKAQKKKKIKTKKEALDFVKKLLPKIA